MTSKPMPQATDLGRHHGGSVNHAFQNYTSWIAKGRPADALGRRVVMGFVLPAFQRGSRWSRDQHIRFIESVWRGIPIGTYSYTEIGSDAPLQDNLLIDGQQRMMALQLYFEGAFAVFGAYWWEVSDADARSFRMTRTFPYYVIKNPDEAYLRSYYDLLNFGGVPHDESERATA